MTASCIGLCIALGLLQALSGALRPHTDPDGLSYMELGEAYLRGDWGAAINQHWSPLYGLVLGFALHVMQPPARWELPLMQAVNFGIFLFCLACFLFFWRELLRRRLVVPRSSAANGVTFPRIAWIVLGFALFAWSSLTLVSVQALKPDMLASALMYVLAGSLLRLQEDSNGRSHFLVFGLALGLVCLARLALLPVAVVFLGMCLVSTRDWRGTLAASGIFAFLVAPLLIGLSVHAGRPTLGATARLAYAWYVNGVPSVHWRGEPPGSGQPRHPTRQLMDSPPVYEFGSPVEGTYSPWYDPAYWQEGLRPRFDAKGQLKALSRVVREYNEWFLRKLGGAIAMVLVLYGMRHGRVGRLRDLASWWILLVPALAAIAMYSLVYVEGRHVASFIVLTWAAVLAAVRLPGTLQARRLASVAAGGIVLVLLVDIATNTAKDMRSFPREQHDRPADVAEGLHRMGVQAGDPVAYIGAAMHDAFWARLARVQIVAEGYFDPGPEFWADAESQMMVVDALFAAGSRAVVAKDVPAGAHHGSWRRIGTTDHFVLDEVQPPGEAAK
ncbi:MAG TPA: hypothetical protein VJP59_07270 [Gemmatimonadota bacterium]|nr:hypothetical protein [Gemmatimonadota bacterium]